MALSKQQKIAIIAIAAVLITLTSIFTLLGVPLNSSEPSLEFPIKEKDRITLIRPYGIEGWSGPGTHHNGIDLMIEESVTIVSPVKGTVIGISISYNTNGDNNNLLLDISILINLGWTVHLVLEPNGDGNDEEKNQAQIDAVMVPLFQRVNEGDTIATLLYDNEYSHLHYGLNKGFTDVCPYEYTSDAAKELFDAIEINFEDAESPCV